MKHSLLLLALVIAASLSACSGTAMLIHNRVVCSVSGGEAFIIGSTGGMFGGSAAVDPNDAATICKK